LVIIDSSVWIPALQIMGSEESSAVARLITNGEAAIVGVVLTEMLRGARTQARLDELHDQLLAAAFIEDTEADWYRAGQISLELRQRGLTIPLQDAIIAAQALAGDHDLFSKDEHFQRIPGLRLYAQERQTN
jgi:predicted nucleic acid-binding protein